MNRILFILGGSGQIGQETCKKLSNEFNLIVVLDLKKPSIENKKVIFEKFDCSNLKVIESNIKNLIKKYGTPHTFINCSYPATKDWPNCSFKKIKIKYLVENLNSHLISYCWTSKIIADAMKKKNKKSSIILISSIYGFLAQDPEIYRGTIMSENFVYPIIKAGIISHTKQMGVYYAPYKININCISAGGIEGKIKGKKKLQESKFKKRYISRVPLRRFCNPSDIAEVCSFLSKDENSYITGQNIILDGGFSLI